MLFFKGTYSARSTAALAVLCALIAVLLTACSDSSVNESITPSPSAAITAEQDGEPQFVVNEYLLFDVTNIFGGASSVLTCVASPLEKRAADKIAQDIGEIGAANTFAVTVSHAGDGGLPERYVVALKVISEGGVPNDKFTAIQRYEIRFFTQFGEGIAPPASDNGIGALLFTYVCARV
ncbi:MAG: hypothetical protein LBN02_02860 [Oscillospiraceae bacterium]|jgi:hypothetical protein|nr:hypothetical protein [Oscillospiraceae bacterium]